MIQEHPSGTGRPAGVRAAARTRPSRVLILTASVGAGHDRPAEMLAAQLRTEGGDVEVVVADALAAMGRVVTAFSSDAAEVVFFRFQWAWDAGFWLFAGCGPTRQATQALLTRVGSPGLLRLVDDVRPDVIVSTYPNVTEVLGRLRRSGRLAVPVCAAITDVSALHYWASEGVDVHLVTHPESVHEVRAVAGPTSEVHCVHGLTAPQFREPRSAADARAALGLPAHGRIVLVSGGGWGVGDVAGAVEEALAAEDVSCVACLCGHNDGLRRRLAAAFAGDPRVRVEGFSECMHEWLAAADALVHSTGGLTVLEATMRGCPAISYGWGRGHLRANNAAFRRFGLAQVASSRAELAAALARALATPRRPDPRFDELSSAAAVVLAQTAARGLRGER